LARQLGVADRVMIKAVSPTDRQGMAALMASAAVVTLMSEYEAHPIAALETTALGRPLLVADMAGLHEFAERGLARSVPLKCPPETLAAAIVDQLRDPLIPERIDLPTWDDCAARLLAVYRDCARSPACAS